MTVTLRGHGGIDVRAYRVTSVDVVRADGRHVTQWQVLGDNPRRRNARYRTSASDERWVLVRVFEAASDAFDWVQDVTLRQLALEAERLESAG